MYLSIRNRFEARIIQFNDDEVICFVYGILFDVVGKIEFYF